MNVAVVKNTRTQEVVCVLEINGGYNAREAHEYVSEKYNIPAHQLHSIMLCTEEIKTNA